MLKGGTKSFQVVFLYFLLSFIYPNGNHSSFHGCPSSQYSTLKNSNFLVTFYFYLFLIRDLEVLAIVIIVEGGGAKSFGPVIYPFCSSPSPPSL